MTNVRASDLRPVSVTDRGRTSEVRTFLGWSSAATQRPGDAPHDRRGPPVGWMNPSWSSHDPRRHLLGRPRRALRRQARRQPHRLRAQAGADPAAHGPPAGGARHRLRDRVAGADPGASRRPRARPGLLRRDGAHRPGQGPGPGGGQRDLPRRSLRRHRALRGRQPRRALRRLAAAPAAGPPGRPGPGVPAAEARRLVPLLDGLSGRELGALHADPRGDALGGQGASGVGHLEGHAGPGARSRGLRGPAAARRGGRGDDGLRAGSQAGVLRPPVSSPTR